MGPAVEHLTLALIVAEIPLLYLLWKRLWVVPCFSLYLPIPLLAGLVALDSGYNRSLVGGWMSPAVAVANIGIAMEAVWRVTYTLGDRERSHARSMAMLLGGAVALLALSTDPYVYLKQSPTFYYITLGGFLMATTAPLVALAYVFCYTGEFLAERWRFWHGLFVALWFGSNAWAFSTPIPPDGAVLWNWVQARVMVIHLFCVAGWLLIAGRAQRFSDGLQGRLDFRHPGVNAPEMRP